MESKDWSDRELLYKSRQREAWRPAKWRFGRSHVPFAVATSSNTEALLTTRRS